LVFAAKKGRSAENRQLISASLVRPRVLEAQAADRLAVFHSEVARRLSEHSQKALAEMLAELPS
ncbi:hypothetical protein ACFPOU_17010, partial [Massilia jejuensis]